MINSTKQILVTLRFSILSIFITFFLATSFFIIGIRYIAFSNAITYTSRTIMKNVSDAALLELTAGIRPAEVGGIFSAELLKSGVLNESQEELENYTYYLVKTLPLIKSAYWGDEHGNFIYSKKENDGAMITEIINHTKKETIQSLVKRDKDGNRMPPIITKVTYDPRLRPWYTGAKNSKHPIWTDIYEFYAADELGISYGYPIYDKNNNLRGIFGLDMSFEYLRRFINRQDISKNGFSFIITDHEDLVAYPNRPPFTAISMKPGHLVNVHSISMPLIDQSIDYYKKTRKQEFTVEYDGKTYLVSYRPVPDLNNLHWLVGVITPKDDFTGILKRINIISLIVSFITLIVGITCVSNLVSRIVKPIKALVVETEKIKNFDLETEISFKSRIKEVVLLRDSINAMKNGLKQFQKYVPKVLVRQLIESGQDIQVGGERKNLTVLFTDIENFTSISEKMDPNDLLNQMCEYFEALTEIIIEYKGTIDKYIGDSIMAFWGAPLDEKHPCENAATVAILCQKRIQQLNERWQAQGKPALNTRIGIHSGEAIVGNIGSTERMNYTAIGDTINIASRLESINKSYKTKIIVSDTVYNEIKDKFTLRLLGSEVVKGRVNAINIYELIN